MDFTVEKRSDEQLRLLQTVLEQSTESVVITTAQLDLPGPQIVYVNPAFTRMTGYTLEEVLGKTPRILQGPSTDRSVLNRLRQDCAAGKVFQGKAINYRKDGSEFYLEWSIGPVWNERGEITHFIATQRDVTERQRIDEELRKSEEEFRSLFELSAVGMTQVSPEGRYLRVNRKLSQMLGYSEEELLQLTLHEVTHPDDREFSAAKLRASFTGLPDEYNIEKRYLRKDGTIIWVLINWTVVRDASGKPLHSVANIQDITERKLIEEALQESEERLELAMEAGDIGTFDWDVRSDRVVWTEQSKAIFGLPSGSSQGVYADWANRVHPDDIIPCEESIRETFRNKRHHWQREYRVKSVDAVTWRWINSRGHVFYDSQGEPSRVIGVNVDVTERRQAEEALKKSAEEIHDLYNHAPCGYHSLDKDGLFVQINDTELEWLGYRREEVIGKIHFGELLTTEGLQSFNDTFPRFMSSGMIQGLEFDLVRKDGTILPVLLSATAIKDQNGNFLMTRSVVYDITERKRAEEAIRMSESHLRQLADAMPQIVYTCRADGMADYVNRRASEYAGLTPEQVVGSAWTDRLHPDDRERTWQRWSEAVKTGLPFEIEYRFHRKDGEYRWHLSRAMPVRNDVDQIVRWIGTSTDIHDRKQSEAEREELLAREQAARAEAEHAAESIRRLQAVTDSALGRFALDDLLHEMLRRVRELLETDCAAILLTTEDGRWLVVRAAIGFEEAAKGLHIPVGKGVAGSIAVQRAPLIVEDISTLDVINPILRQRVRSLIGAPLIVEGRLIGVIHADTISARRFSESDLRLLQLAADRIALAIEQTRLYEVEKNARRQAEESNRVKDEFLALVSHELRSPLNAMLGYARLLRFGSLDSQKVRNAVDVIERSGMIQTQLIDDLLDTARIISGKLRLELGPVDLFAVVEGAIQTIYSAADAKGITIETDLSPKVGQITGDPERLQQVVWNLLSNAVKFTPAGGRVKTRLERADPHICITVSDSGKGISPYFLPYVFDRFRQADASSSRRYGGLGLGLALVKYLVELHGGTIEALSDGEGKGSTFKVLLPVPAVSWSLRKPEMEPLTTVATRQATLAGVRALVVDDEDDARELVKAVIAQYGADVTAARSAAEAFELITTAPEQVRPDVAVADLGMPDEDGYSLLHRVREWEHEHGLYTPAVALTAYGRSEDRKRALMAGFQMHVAKPVEPDELAIVVASLVHRQGSGTP
jgi:PAS domain S-box-containing protein